MQTLSESLQILSTTTCPLQQKLHQIHELSLQLPNPDTDPHYNEDIQELSYILNHVLAYPNIEEAQLHMECNRLGVDDLRSEVKIRNQSVEARGNMELCLCCGFVRQTEQLKLMTHLDQINNVGVSTYLYFRTIKNLFILLLILTLTFSAYSITTNIKASSQYKNLHDQTSPLDPKYLSTLSYLILSLGSKQLHPTPQNRYQYTLQCWIGLGVILAWLVIFFGLKFVEKKEEILLDLKTISASDFSVMIENVPRDVTINELQRLFRQYQQTVREEFGIDEKFDIVKINVGKPFYLNQSDFDDQQLNQLRQQHKEYIQTFISWIKHRKHSPTFPSQSPQRSQCYKSFKSLLHKITQKELSIYQQISTKIKNQQKSETTTIFVTFSTDSAMKLITKLNYDSWLGRVRAFVGGIFGGQIGGRGRIWLGREGVRWGVRMVRAPEPEDIIWSNLGVPARENIKRKVITYTITLTILVISFIIVYLLSKAQQTTSSNMYLSVLISISISSINLILALVIRKISSYQKDPTKIGHERSFATKSILASLINTIVIPILVNYYIKQDIYGKNGLANDVFMLGLTNSFVSPILKLIDVAYIVNRIKKYYVSKPDNRLWINQIKLNEAFEYLTFQVGEQYVYLVSLYLFTCFFVSLQPIVSLFALCGIGFMYWVQKYSLFNKMKRPIPGTNLVNAAMFKVVLSGALVFSLGNLTWSNFMPDGTPREALVPNLVGLGVGLLVFMMPYSTILGLFLNKNHEQNLNFHENRLILSSQYDRLNPMTSIEAMKQFQQFFASKNTAMGNSLDPQKLIQQEYQARNIQSSKRLSINVGNVFPNLLELTPLLKQKKYHHRHVDSNDIGLFHPHKIQATSLLRPTPTNNPNPNPFCILSLLKIPKQPPVQDSPQTGLRIIQSGICSEQSERKNQGQNKEEKQLPLSIILT